VDSSLFIGHSDDTHQSLFDDFAGIAKSDFALPDWHVLRDLPKANDKWNRVGATMIMAANDSPGRY
jgi:hypothetical protein